MGNLVFSALLVPNPLGPNQKVKVDTNDTIRLENQTQLKSMIWNYPLPNIHLRFYEDGKETPYATIIGPKTATYQATVVGFKDGCKGSLTCVVEEAYKSGKFFASDTAYLKIVDVSKEEESKKSSKEPKGKAKGDVEKDSSESEYASFVMDEDEFDEEMEDTNSFSEAFD